MFGWHSLLIKGEVFVFVSPDRSSSLCEACSLCQLSSHLLNKSSLFHQVAERALWIVCGRWYDTPNWSNISFRQSWYAIRKCTACHLVTNLHWLKQEIWSECVALNIDMAFFKRKENKPISIATVTTMSTSITLHNYPFFFCGWNSEVPVSSAHPCQHRYLKWWPFWQVWGSVSLWFFIAFPWWLVMLDVFACTKQTTTSLDSQLFWGRHLCWSHLRMSAMSQFRTNIILHWMEKAISSKVGITQKRNGFQKPR